VVGLAAARLKYALTGLQGHSVSSIAFWPSLLDYGNWLVIGAAGGADHTRAKRWLRRLRPNCHPLAKLLANSLAKYGQPITGATYGDQGLLNFDLDTVLLQREILVDAWASLPPKQRATTSKTLLAEFEGFSLATPCGLTE
jgi:hypothetical protein